MQKADRVELCSRLDLDGLTPSRSIIKEAINSLTIPVKVMIRPKDGGFIYSKKDITKMKSEIDFCKSIGVSRFSVFRIFHDVRRCVKSSSPKLCGNYPRQHNGIVCLVYSPGDQQVIEFANFFVLPTSNEV